jgi:hypothetical protein
MNLISDRTSLIATENAFQGRSTGAPLALKPDSVCYN